MAHRTKTWCMAAAALVMAAPQFALRDTEGTVHRQEEWSKAQAIVIFFTTTDCPLSNGYVPEMNRIRKAYWDRGVAFYAVQTDTTIGESEVRRHARDFAFSFPVLLDPQQFLVQLAGATATPEVAVLSSSGKVLYLGRIDNRVEDFDKRRSVVTASDLRDALDAVLSGKPVPHARTPVVGCGINFVTQEKKP
ncbi:MAG TPA: redoxin family protein [Terriglobia bacterium]|nr:redoxin family protein [Terriglobia bacterium]